MAGQQNSGTVLKNHSPPIWILASSVLVTAFVVCSLWVVVTRLRTADEPLDRDICTQILMGRVLADGGKMYVDTIEFKPPGMFAIWQMIHQLAGTSPQVVVWVNILVTTLTMLGVFLAGSARPWGRMGGFWAMVFWTLISGDMMLQANQPSNEVFMNLFMSWGIAMWMRADSMQAGRWHYAAAGLLLGLVTLIKPALTTLVCMTLAWVLARGLNLATLQSRAWAIRWVWLPIAACWGLMVVYFAWQGRAGVLYDCLVRYGVFYARSGSPGALGIWMNIWQGLTKELIPTYLSFLIPLMGLSVVGIWGGLRGSRRSQALALTGCLFGTFLSVSIPGRFYAHYYQLYLPVLAIGAGWGMVIAAGHSLPRRVVTQGIGAGIVVLLLWHIGPDYRFNGRTWTVLKYGGDLFLEVERCGHAVSQMLKPDECLYAWGIDPGVYYYSNRRPASGIFWADRLVSGPSKSLACKKVLADLEKNQPPLVLIEDLVTLAPDPDNPVRKWISERYTESPEAKFSQRFSVYLRRDSDLASRLATNHPPFVLTLPEMDSVVLRQRSVNLLQEGRTNEALAYIRRAQEIDHDRPSPQGYNILCEQLIAKGRLEEAIRQIHEILRLYPDDAPAHNKLGIVLGEQGRLKEAIQEYEETLRLNPADATVHNNLGIMLEQLGQIDRAIQEFHASIRLHPDDPRVHNNLGYLLDEKGQIDESIRQYNEALRLDPYYPEAHFNLGYACLEKGRYEEAIRQYTEAIRLQPDYPVAYNNLGLVLNQEARTDEAIRHYQEALRLNPDYCEAHFNLAYAFNEKGQTGDAIQQIKEVIRLKPDFAGASNILSTLLARQGVEKSGNALTNEVTPIHQP